MMNSRPRLPARRRRELDAVRQGPPDLHQLQQQLVSNDTFRQLLDQPHKVAAVLQADPVLQQAAADSPEIAQLLDPATMQQALQLLTQPQQQQQAGNTTLPIQRKALMQLQNYAMQMQQARAAGCDVRQQQDASLQLANAPGKMTQLSQQQQQGATTPSQEAMWAALQQRLTKYQQRTQALAAGQQGVLGAMQQHQQQQQPSDHAWVGPSHPASQQQQQQQQQQHSMLAGQAAHSATAVSAGFTPTPHTTVQAAQATATAAVPCSEPRASDGNLTLQELLLAFPDVLLSGGPTSSSHATIGLLSAVAEQAPMELTAAAADSSSSCISSSHLAPLQMQPSEACALPFSPTWRHQDHHQQQQQHHHQQQQQQHHHQQQQQQPAGPSLLWPQSISDPAVNAAAAVAPFSSSSAVFRVSESSSRPLSAMRSASTLGHRILRPHSSSPIPLGSGATPLSFEQLGSGEVIVDITPPTKITKELSWSVDPDADYIIDASGSFSPLPISAAAAAGTAASAALYGSGPGSLAAASWGASLDSLAALAASGSVGRMVHSSSGGNYHGLYSSCDGPLCPLPEDGSSCTAAAAAGVMALGQAEAAAAAAPRLSSSSSTGSGGCTTKAKVVNARLKQHSDAAAAAAVSGRGAGANRTAATAASSVNTSQQQQFQQQQQQQQYVLPVSTHSSSSTSTAPAAAAGAPYTSNHGSSYHSSSSSTVPDGRGTQPGGFGYGEAQRSKTLNPKSYYEDVTPSSWRPGDMGEVHGDYLDLYRRAYCSYADAIFPPLWLSLMCVLVSSHMVPMWQLLLLAAVTFWGGLYVMAVKWAGVPSGRLPLSRAVPMMVVSLELLCIGAFVWHVLPEMWLGRSVSCTVILAAAAAMTGLHLTAHLQDPGYTAKPLDPEEGPYARRLSAPDDTVTTGPAAVHSIVSSSHSAGKLAAGLYEQQQQQQRQQQQLVPKLAGRALNSCWTCGMERNLRSKHCPICKRCVERFDHHCPVIGNCVGAGNHRSFVGFLLAMVLCQLLFCHLIGGMFIQQHGMQLFGGQMLMPPASMTTSNLHAIVAEHAVVSDAEMPSAPAGQTIVNAGQTLVDRGQTTGQTAGQTWVPGEIELGKPVVAVPGTNVAAAPDAAAAAAAAAADAVASGNGEAASSFPNGAQAAAATAAANTGRQLKQIASGATSAANAAVPDASISITDPDAGAAVTDSSTGGAAAADDGPAAAGAGNTDSLSESLTGSVVKDAAASSSYSSSSGSSRAAELEQLLHRGAGWGWQGWWLTIKALWAASADSPGLLLLLLLQFPALFISCTLLFRALALAAANLTVNEWTNRHRYLHLQHQAAGFCNRFDRGPAHNCWEFWVGPAVVDWWSVWQQGEDELQSNQQTVLVNPSATSIIRWWDMRWAAYQRKLLAARERRKAIALRRKMEALGLQWDGQDSD